MKITRIAALALLLGIIVAVLVLGKGLLIPFAIAVGIWLLISAIASWLERFKVRGKPLPVWLRTTISTIIILGFLFISVEIIVQSINQILADAPRYGEKLKLAIDQFLETVGRDRLPTVSELLSQFDLQPAVGSIAASVTAFTADLVLIVVYTVFLLLEQKTFPRKWRAMFKTQEAYHNAQDTLEKITGSMRQYAIVKTGLCLLTACLSLILFIVIELEYPILWAFLVFVLNYIPTLGSIAAAAFPALFALLQYDGYAMAILVVAVVGAIDLTLSHFLEPRLLGRALDISPIVVLLSLALWGTMWGVFGMVLAVPIVVSLMIILAAFPETRPVAMWLSQNGLQNGEVPSKKGGAAAR